MKPQADFDPILAAKKLLREARSGALATLMPATGDPYCSLVNVASAFDGAPLILISTLAIHTKNVIADSRVSLMVDERKEGDPLQGARVMLMGHAAVTTDEHDRRRYLARQPEAAMFAGFKDFAFYRIEISAAHLVAGFGRIVDLKPQDILVDATGAEDLLAAEERASAHMNEDHADALRLYATKLYGAPDGDWRCAGFDPEGLELQHGRIAARIPFPQRVNGSGPLRAVLVQMAGEARGD
ncbi:MAG: HugZ family protein [Pseudorhodoplanes sp.]|uniref:HugZ family pyridoxamine 5'-phosphate oxidase n=1 Tax=Pseudorhodoplanes sp. TaxID=1934341 RepID=UPI003D09A2FA